jgi:hypothetical protein
METQGSNVAVADESVDADASELAAMVPPRFTVRDEKSADWLVRKLVEAEAHIRRVKEQAEREVRRTERERDFLLYHFGKDLEKWAKKQLDKSKGRRKSLLLLSGTVGFRTIAAKLVVENDIAAIAWAKKHCRDAVVVKERVNKATLDEHFETNGDLPDGARLEAAHQRFYVK